MSRKTEVAIALLVILMLIAVLLFLFRRNESKTANSEPKTTTQVGTDTVTETPTTPAPITHATATTVVRIFVERFGSYSTDVDYANVTDVLPMVTDSLKTQLQDIAEDARKTADDSYYGVSTNVIKITTDKTSDTATTLTVKTQREEAFGSPSNTTVRYQDIRVEFIKVGEDWLVDGFTWL